MTTNRLGGALTLFFTDVKVENYEQAEQTDGELFAKFFKLMLKNGINLAPSKYEAWFLTIAHKEQDIIHTLEAVDRSFKELPYKKTSNPLKWYAYGNEERLIN